MGKEKQKPISISSIDNVTTLLHRPSIKRLLTTPYRDLNEEALRNGEPPLQKTNLKNAKKKPELLQRDLVINAKQGLFKDVRKTAERYLSLTQDDPAAPPLERSVAGYARDKPCDFIGLVQNMTLIHEQDQRSQMNATLPQPKKPPKKT